MNPAIKLSQPDRAGAKTPEMDSFLIDPSLEATVHIGTSAWRQVVRSVLDDPMREVCGLLLGRPLPHRARDASLNRVATLNATKARARRERLGGKNESSNSGSSKGYDRFLTGASLTKTQHSILQDHSTDGRHDTPDSNQGLNHEALRVARVCAAAPWVEHATTGPPAADPCHPTCNRARLTLGKRIIHVEEVLPVPNITSCDPRSHYQIDPAYLLPYLGAVNQPNRLVGFYHSHPESDATASQEDHANAWCGYCYLIVAVRSGAVHQARCWRRERDDRPLKEIAFQLPE